MSVQTNTNVDWSSPHYHVRLIKRRRSGVVDLTSRVTSMTHTDSGQRKTSTLSLELNNADDYILAQEDLMRKGSVIAVTYGYPGQMRQAGEFVTKEHSASSASVTITGYERKRSRISRKMESRIWKNRSRSDVVREVLLSHGFPASQLEIEETSTKYPTITQVREDDWAFVQRLADLEGFVFYADERGVHWHRIVKSSNNPSHLWRYVRNAVGVGFIKDYSIESFGAGLPGRIVLKGRDPLKKKSFTVEGSGDATRDLEELNDTTDIVTPDDGDRDAGGDFGYEIVRNIGMRSEAEAKKLADALYKEYRYSALKMSIEIFGDPTIRTNHVVLVWGVGPAVDGLFIVKEVTHSLGDGYSSSVQLKRDGLRKLFGAKAKAANKKLDDLFARFNSSSPNLVLRRSKDINTGYSDKTRAWVQRQIK